MDGLGEGVVGKTGVGVDKNQECPLGLLGQLMARPSLAGPTLGEIFSAKQTNPWVALEPLADESGGTIGGVVIENENFKIGVLATDQRLQAWLDSLFLVSVCCFVRFVCVSLC